MIVGRNGSLYPSSITVPHVLNSSKQVPRTIESWMLGGEHEITTTLAA